MSEFHIKYRPADWDQIVAHKPVVRSLRKVLGEGRSRAFLFIGPSGVGKTTIARLVAKHVGSLGDNMIEIDGATHTGIDDMRALIERLQYNTIDGSSRCVIVDEVHAISRQSFQALLKIIEEPPLGVYWCLCTTEADKVPKTIRTRCASYELKLVPDNLILDKLLEVRELEKLRIPEEGLELIIEASQGSLRQALVYLAECGDFTKLPSIQQVLNTVVENAEARELCSLLLSMANGSSVRWSKVAALLRALDTPAESVRVVVLKWMNRVALGGHEGKSMAAMRVISCFAQPFTDREGMAPLTLACARVWKGEDD